MGAITEISDEFDYTYIRAAKDFVTRKWHRFPVQSRQDWEQRFRYSVQPCPTGMDTQAYRSQSRPFATPRLPAALIKVLEPFGIRQAGRDLLAPENPTIRAVAWYGEGSPHTVSPSRPRAPHSRAMSEKTRAFSA